MDRGRFGTTCCLMKVLVNAGLLVNVAFRFGKTAMLMLTGYGCLTFRC